jgi:hypothetical protein
MKNFIKLFSVAIVLASFVVSCKSDETTTPAVVNFYVQQEQMARPAINTVFNAAADKDAFNTTIPSQMNAAFGSKFIARLNAFGYKVNALGQDAATFGGFLSTDVLNVSTIAPATTFYDGKNLLTGRNLTDDVIDVELLLIFGGADFKSNPNLTSDNVGANDKAFSASFPYLASPW